MGREGWPERSDPTDELLELPLLKKIMLVLIERFQVHRTSQISC